MKRLFSWILVVLQFALLIVLMANMSFICWPCIGLYIVSGCLGVWAVGVMKVGNFNIVPDVKVDSILVTKLPYKYIRHPMYVSVILLGLGMMLSAYSGFTLSIWLVLVIVMFMKAKYEESLLMKRFPDYGKYCADTKAFIPFLL